MKSDREKLVEIISNTGLIFEGSGIERLRLSVKQKMVNAIADALIANGVTFNQWIPVTERLPKSEKVVLVSVVSKQFGYRKTLMAAHIGHHEVTTEDWREYEGDTEYDEENDCFWIPECWWESNAIEDNGNWIIDGDYDVTHWMSLPELPKEEE